VPNTIVNRCAYGSVAIALGAAGVKLGVRGGTLLIAEGGGALAQGGEADNVGHDLHVLRNLLRQVVGLSDAGDGDVALGHRTEQGELGLQHLVGGLDRHVDSHHVAHLVHADVLRGNTFKRSQNSHMFYERAKSKGESYRKKQRSQPRS
jgi:hypothetical protein